MTRKEAIEILNSLEQKYPVDQWTIDGITVWPVIKIDLFFKWFNKYYSKELISDTNTQENSTTKKIIKCVRSFIKLGKLLLQAEKKVTVLFSGANTHRVDFQDAFINRYFQPLIEYIKEEEGRQSLMIDYLPRDSSKNYKPQTNLFFLDEYRLAARIITEVRSRRLKYNLHGYEEFLNEVSERFNFDLNKTQYRKSIEQIVRETQANAFVYDIFLRKYNPGHVMGLCYYSGAMYGMNYAAHKRGIPSIDMQHGGQGELHAAYAGFEKIPSTGYNIMPKVFWCWDEASAETIRAWTDKQTFHQVKVGGNPWLRYCAQFKETYPFPGKRIILYTMQFNELEDYLVEAIKNTPEDYSWWLRLHPCRLDGLPRLIEILKNNGILDKVEFDKATNYPLPVILSKAHVHLSKYSGSVIEAAQMGVKTIVLDPIGVNAYKNQIHEGSAIAFTTGSASQLIGIIESINNKFTNKEMPAYKSVLHQLLEG